MQRSPMIYVSGGGAEGAMPVWPIVRKEATVVILDVIDQSTPTERKNDV